MQKAIFQIASMDCPGCGKKIEDNLLNQNGVKSVKVFSVLGKVRTEFDETKTKTEQLEAIINNLGFLVKFKKIVEGDVKK